jgi:hypothetical protein
LNGHWSSYEEQLMREALVYLFDHSLAVAAKRQAITITPEVLKLITDRHREQKSLRAIANELNRLGIKTYRGKRWYASSIKLQLNRVRRMVHEEASARRLPNSTASCSQCGRARIAT